MYDEGYTKQRGAGRRGSNYSPRMGDSFGNVLLMDAYRSATNKGSRRNLWIIGLLATGYGAVKLTQVSGRALSNGAKYSVKQIKAKNEAKKQQQKELEYASQTIEKPASMMNQEEPATYEVPFITRLTQRLETEPGVYFKCDLENLKKGEDESKRKLNIQLGKEHQIQVTTMGVFDTDGEPLLEEGATHSILLLLSRFPKKYERGILVIMDEFIRIGKVRY